MDARKSGVGLPRTGPYAPNQYETAELLSKMTWITTVAQSELQRQRFAVLPRNAACKREHRESGRERLSVIRDEAGGRTKRQHFAESWEELSCSCVFARVRSMKADKHTAFN